MKTAAVRAAEEWAWHAPIEFLICRVGRGGHDWPQWHQDMTWNVREGGTSRQGVWAVEMICSRCGTECLTVMDRRTGELDSSGAMVYPGGYKFEGGDGAPMSREQRGVVRLIMRQRIMEGDLAGAPALAS